MSFDPFSLDLPIKEIIPAVKEILTNENTLIVKAPPGAGKSTLLPLALMNEPWLEGKKVLILEPRRLAAKSIAMRMADLQGTKIGEEVGYMIRFENRTSPHTKIDVLTEGILTRLIQQDNALENVGLVIFDEFHERNIHADVAMALCREVQQVLRPDLRIMIMSATIDLTQLAHMLSAKEIESKGRQYPVDVKYWGDTDEWSIVDTVNNVILKSIDEYEGDILVFLPGQAQIMQCHDFLRSTLPHFAIHPLFGMLPFQKQQAAIVPNPHKRKIVLATSIAETSLTIEGISLVVDSGYGKTSKFDPRSGLSRLKTIKVTQDAADQRAGRAGRLGPGHCIRLWSKATQERLETFRTPEILEADLASLVLDLYAWGIEGYQQMVWLTPPPQGAFQQAVELLESLEAILNGKLTEHGLQMQKLPCHPRIAHMLIKSKNIGQQALATDLAAVIEEKDPLGKDAGTDINHRIEKLRRLRKENNVHGPFRKVDTVAQHYRRMLGIEASNDVYDIFETGILLAYAYPDRIACARPGNNAQFQLSNGRIAMMGHRDDLAHESWLAVANMDARDGIGKIFLASPINPKDLMPMIEDREIIEWDFKQGKLGAEKVMRIGNIVLKSQPLKHVDPELAERAILKAIKTDGDKLLNFSESVVQLQNRIESLNAWNSDEIFPAFTTEEILNRAPEWLPPYISNIRREEDLFKLDLKEILINALPWEKQQLLEKLAPEKIEVPSGSYIKLHYQPNGEKPILAVRLQELFGMVETPLVNDGRQGVLIHLLSPGFKPVQVTDDLRSFWQNTYFEVKKELKRRYPKHSWPEEPLHAEAVRGVKRRN
ncbi:ATP-dependent helicase HrpB [Litoribacter ruber]|uniref:ATP-dependent helicase HrpB n=1 Tax=Litoribacter ruber TaxID=702568 RepID=UPI001FE72FEA|nr:ATP-dependent helicase HrpB [Litoribacter alkaliphilus]